MKKKSENMFIEDDVRDLVVHSKELEVALKDTEADLDQILEETTFDISGEYEDASIIEHPHKPNAKRKYSVDLKKLALLFLQTMIHTSGDNEGKPQYTRVSRLIDVDPRLLYSWNTIEREKIERQASAIDSTINEYVKLKMNITMIKMLNELGNRDLSKMGDKDLIYMLNSIYHKWRLEQGMSTQNIAVQHGVALPPPKIEDPR